MGVRERSFEISYGDRGEFKSAQLAAHASRTDISAPNSLHINHHQQTTHYWHKQYLPLSMITNVFKGASIVINQYLMA